MPGRCYGPASQTDMEEVEKSGTQNEKNVKSPEANCDEQEQFKLSCKYQRDTSKLKAKFLLIRSLCHCLGADWWDREFVYRLQKILNNGRSRFQEILVFFYRIIINVVHIYELVFNSSKQRNLPNMTCNRLCFIEVEKKYLWVRKIKLCFGECGSSNLEFHFSVEQRVSLFSKSCLAGMRYGEVVETITLMIQIVTCIVFKR